MHPSHEPFRQWISNDVHVLCFSNNIQLPTDLHIPRPKCPSPWVVLDFHLTHSSLAHMSLQPKRHFDRFIRFCRVQDVIKTYRDTTIYTRNATWDMCMRSGLIITLTNSNSGILYYPDSRFTVHQNLFLFVLSNYGINCRKKWYQPAAVSVLLYRV